MSKIDVTVSKTVCDYCGSLIDENDNHLGNGIKFNYCNVESTEKVHRVAKKIEESKVEAELKLTTDGVLVEDLHVHCFEELIERLYLGL